MEVSKTHLENMTFKERWEYLIEGANQLKVLQFQNYHKDNREVFQTMVELAEEAWDKGVVKMSHWMLLNRVRWEYEVTSFDVASPFKINNNYFAFYARLLIAKRPKFASMLTLKGLKE